MTESGIRVALGGETRAIEDGDHREVEARICCYGVGPDTYNTTWAPGWASDGLRESTAAGTPVTAVFGHDEKQMTNVIGSVVNAEDRPDGLYIRVRMANFDEVPAARTAYSLLRDGHIRGWSFKFRDGVTQADPEHRDAMQFTRARLVHVSPVVDPSIPGTATVGVRSRDDAVEELAAAIRSALASDEGRRSLTITVGDDGTITTTGAPVDTGGGGDADADPASLAAAIDAALDAAQRLIDGVDTSGLDPAVAQALNLATAAGVAADELLEALGVDDVDEPADEGDEGDDGTRSAGAASDTEPAETQPAGDELTAELREARAALDRALR